MRILSGASRCDRESFVGNGPIGDHRFIEVIHAFNWDTHDSFRNEKMKTKLKITRELRCKTGKIDNIELKWR